MKKRPAAAAAAAATRVLSTTTPATATPQPSSSSSPATSSVVLHRRNRELQLLNTEMELLQEELDFLHNLPPASKACKEFVELVQSRSDPFFPNADGVEPKSWPYDRPVKASRWCWRF